LDGAELSKIDIHPSDLYKKIKNIELKKEVEDGIYIFYISSSKLSVEFDLKKAINNIGFETIIDLKKTINNIGFETINYAKLEIEYINVKFDDYIEDGEIDFHLISNVKYDGIKLKEFQQSFISRNVSTKIVFVEFIEDDFEILFETEN
jgi:hypothetical protein